MDVLVSAGPPCALESPLQLCETGHDHDQQSAPAAINLRDLQLAFKGLDLKRNAACV